MRAALLACFVHNPSPEPASPGSVGNTQDRPSHVSSSNYRAGDPISRLGLPLPLDPLPEHV